ncbi:MAG: DNA polymerase III subunit delta [Lutibacter sp.]
MKNLQKIVSDIRNKNISPIYFLMGDEPYYIDNISEFIENNVLAEEEKGFNETILYGCDVTISQIIDQCKRFPMMAEYQVVIIREAQDLYKTINQLEDYSANPVPSTILVVNYKYKKLDKRTKLYKNISKNGVVFESKKLYESQIGSWLENRIANLKLKINPKANAMLVEFLGSDLSKLNNEINKLKNIVGENATITPDIIEKHIGISKDFNHFELQNALAEKNVVKANRIINYFGENQRKNHIILTVAILNGFFTQLLNFHSLKDKSEGNVKRNLKFNSTNYKVYKKALKNYPLRKVTQVINDIKEADLKSKGVGANNLPAIEILKELTFKILH